MKKNKIKTTKEFSDIIPFEDKMFGDYLVVINRNGEDVSEYLKMIDKKTYDEVYKNSDFTERFNELLDGGVLNLKFGEFSADVIVLRKFGDIWQDYELLMHEVVHLKQNFFNERSIMGEYEFEAYWIESTFRQIRKKIYESYSKFLKTKK